VRAGDTLDAIARSSGTTVDAIIRLNPGIDPEALRVGQRVRVAP
jgi:LysM repeat protein